METKMLIGGAFEAGTETEENVLNPRTGETIVNLPEADATALETRIKTFTDAMENNEAAEPIALSSDEVNYLITQNEDMANIIRVNIMSNRLEGQVSAPLDQVGDMFKGLRDCMLGSHIRSDDKHDLSHEAGQHT